MSFDYKRMIDEAHAIDIVEVGSLCMNSFCIHNGKPTAECNRHTDNKKGNFSFDKKRNIAKCFTCGESFTTINLVKEYKFKNSDTSFKDAINFLYQNFPSEFTEKPFSNFERDYDDWTGISNKDYSWLGINGKVCLEGKLFSMRDLAINSPIEHDILLVETVKSKKQLIEKIFKLSRVKNCNEEKLKNDRKEVYQTLLSLLKKGLMNKKLILDKEKIDLDLLLTELDNLK